MIDKRWVLPTALLLFITLILSACAPGGAASDGLIISEVMAKNNGALADDEGNYPDWIELHNPTDKAVNLKGYSLTDDSRKKGKFVFPEMEIGAGDYLVVFASGTERVDAENRTCFFERYVCPRFTTPDENGSVILDYGIFLAD